MRQVSWQKPVQMDTNTPNS